MRSDFGLQLQQKVPLTNDGATSCDDSRDDTMVSGRPKLDMESKPLFRTTSPKIEYAASSPYYDVLLYSFTPEQEQKRKHPGKTSDGNKINKQILSNMDKGLDVKIDSTNNTSGNNVNTKYKHDQLCRQSKTSVQTTNKDIIEDGDQSPIYDPYVQKVYLELFRSGTCLNVCTSCLHFAEVTINVPGTSTVARSLLLSHSCISYP